MYDLNIIYEHGKHGSRSNACHWHWSMSRVMNQPGRLQTRLQTHTYRPSMCVACR